MRRRRAWRRRRRQRRRAWRRKRKTRKRGRRRKGRRRKKRKRKKRVNRKRRRKRRRRKKAVMGGVVVRPMTHAARQETPAARRTLHPAPHLAHLRHRTPHPLTERAQPGGVEPGGGVENSQMVVRLL